jgi:hypothetical protein
MNPISCHLEAIEVRDLRSVSGKVLVKVKTGSTVKKTGIFKANGESLLWNGRIFL